MRLVTTTGVFPIGTDHFHIVDRLEMAEEHGVTLLCENLL